MAKSPFSPAWQWRITMPAAGGDRRDEAAKDAITSKSSQQHQGEGRNVRTGSSRPKEIVPLPLELDGVPPKVARERAIKTLELVGLAGRRTHLPGKMSGGEQQRVAIARALVIEPAIVLADEPTGNLDSANSKRITHALRELVDQHGQTIVMVTHDPAVAEQADRVVYL